MKKIIYSLSFLFAFAVCFLFAGNVSAATLYVSPASANLNVGDKVTTVVYVNSGDDAMNGASGKISFTKDVLEVVSVTKGGLFTLWTQEPSFSNTAGTVGFEGVVFNPGFTGKAGKILQVVFRAKKSGTGSVSIGSASVLANDGEGTEILTGTGSASYKVAEVKVEPVKPPVKPVEPTKPVTEPVKPVTEAPKVELPGTPKIFPVAPVITAEWLATNAVKLSWTGEAGVEAVRYSLANKYVEPAMVITPATFTFEKTDLEDGVYVFSLRFKNSGGWGPVATYEFKVDTKSPEPFAISLVNGAKETFELSPKIKFSLVDGLSGIASYQVNVGGGFDWDEVKVAGNGEYTYTLPKQTPGSKTVTVAAYDKAGNMTSSSLEFVIKQLKAPLFTDYPLELKSGDNLVISGVSEANEKVRVYWQYNHEKVTSRLVLVDEEGKFVFATGEKVKQGVYRVYAEMVRGDGTKSESSAPVLIVVRDSFLMQFGRFLLQYWVVVLSVTGVVIFLILMLWYSVRRRKERNRFGV
ncbi:MAG TPA: cohesin domain-containing protein [Candidatus Magasanikbacteria bacterium]|nr:cohesin domain-containing protein [Candidatus Magasanikbacteria bacterium]